MVFVAIIGLRSRHPMVEVSNSEMGVVRIIRDWFPNAIQMGSEFFDRESTGIVAFYCARSLNHLGGLSSGLPHWMDVLSETTR